MRKYALIALGCLILLGCEQGSRAIVIFHTNDMHGRFLAEVTVADGDTTWTGGFASLSAYLMEYRSKYPKSIYLDAGDLMTGNPICNIEYHGIEGGALLEFLRRCELDAFTIGNHEFDLGSEHAIAFAKAAKFPMLCANLVSRETGELAFTPYTIIKRNGLRIGIIGLLLDDLAEVVSRSAIEPFRIIDGAETAQKYINELDPETDLLILLTHNGLETDRELARNVHNADVIVGGHSHHRLEEPELVNNILIVQSGSYCKYLGVLNLTVAGDTVSDYSRELPALVADGVEPDPAVAALTDSFQTIIDAQYGEVIGEFRVPMTRSYFSTSILGNWLCDVMRRRYQVDIAIANSGGIRKNLEPGPVTRLDIVEMLPFLNSVVKFEATGDDLMKMAREQARAQGLEAHGILQMSGMQIRYRKRNDIVSVDEVLVGNHLLVPERTYTLVSHDYVTISQPQHYLRFEPRDLYGTGELFSDVIIEEILKSEQPMSADPRSRLERIR